MPFAPAQSYMGLALEAVRGTAVPPTFFIPVVNPQLTPTITEVEDKAFRGSMADVYDLVAAQRFDEYTFDTQMRADTMPVFWRALLGSTDAVTGSVAPYTHTIGLLNNAGSTGNQPPSMTIVDTNGFNSRQITAAQLDEVSLKFAADGLVDMSVKASGNPSTVITPAPTSSFTSLSAAPTWGCVVTIGGTVSAKLVDGELDFKRNVKPIFTANNTQSPYRLWTPFLSCAGKMTLVYEDDTDLANYLNGNTLTTVFQFNQPSVAGENVTIQMSSVKYKTGKVVRGSKEWIETEVELQPLPNSTDAVAGGVAAVKTITANAQSTAY